MVYGAKIIAQALHDLGVRVIFGLPGLPVTDIGQEGLYLGMRFITFRNEQAAVYAASAYGYLTGKPGVCIAVGGPGMLHVLPGVCQPFPDEVSHAVKPISETTCTDPTRVRQLMASTRTRRFE